VPALILYLLMTHSKQFAQAGQIWPPNLLPF
jgi:hypothetical protein